MIAEAEARGQPLAVADITLYEMADLLLEGPFERPQPPRTWLDATLSAGHFEVVAITPEIASIAASLRLGLDAFDRLVVATALALRIPLITGDSQIHDAAIEDLDLIW